MNFLRNTGRYGTIILALLSLSCGTDTLREAFLLGKKVGSLKNPLSHSSKEDALDNSENEPKGRTNTAEQEKKTSQQPARKDDDSSIINPNQPFIGSLPYYCNPLEYPAHIINAAAACKPYLQQIYQHQSIRWTDVFGSQNPSDCLHRGFYGRNNYGYDRRNYGYDCDDDYPDLSRNDDDSDGRHYRYLHNVYERQKHHGRNGHNYGNDDDFSSKGHHH